MKFIHEIKSTVKTILSKEVGRKVANDRFYDQKQRTSYPIKVVIFNDKNILGYFDNQFYELGFHECLMHTSSAQLHQVIRHEVAHYLTFITYGESVQAHGLEFRALCKSLGWGEQVYSATTCLEGGELNASSAEESGILRKVKKLMALASSSNQNEAELAMVKSQQLLLKHNIESTYFGCDSDERVFLKRILKQKRKNGKMRSVARILETFFVSIVYTRRGEFTHLEILGNAVNIEIAEYVASFLHLELDALWAAAKKSANLKGAVAKNSFFLGIAKGYCNKIQALKKEYSSDASRALLVIQKQLVDAQAMAYDRLVFAKSGASHCPAASKLGEQMGRKLSINPAIKDACNPSQALLT